MVVGDSPQAAWLAVKCSRSNSFGRALDIQVTSWGQPGQHSRRDWFLFACANARTLAAGSRKPAALRGEENEAKPSCFLPSAKAAIEVGPWAGSCSAIKLGCSASFLPCPKSAPGAASVLHRPPAPALCGQCLGQRHLPFSSLSLGFWAQGIRACSRAGRCRVRMGRLSCMSPGKLSQHLPLSGCYPHGTRARRCL